MSSEMRRDLPTVLGENLGADSQVGYGYGYGYGTLHPPPQKEDTERERERAGLSAVSH